MEVKINRLPQIDLRAPETGCCPRFMPAPWDNQVFVFENKLFLKAKTCSFLHIPLNMGSVMKRTWRKIEQAQAASGEFLMLTHENSAWSQDHYFAVEKQVKGSKTVEMTGTYMTKVFEGPYKNIPKWIKEMASYVELKGRTLKDIYFFNTTCPKCAKFYGKNYVVIFAEV